MTALHISTTPQHYTATIIINKAMFMDEEFRTRILLALKSCLPNEVDWAFNTLIKFSFASENFNLLLGFADPFFAHTHALSDTEDVMFSTKENQELFERVLQVFHILRNFSFLDINVRRLAHHEKLGEMLLAGITLSLIPKNIAPQVIVTHPDHPYLVIISGLLFTNDRALILGAIRWLTRVAVTEINERVLSVAHPQWVRRLAQLLLVDDEELTAATLEYFYQYSGLHGDFATHLVQLCPGNLIGLLVGFLSYKSTLAPAAASVNSTIHGVPAAQWTHQRRKVPAAPVIPDLTNYTHLDEPYRCLGWLKERLQGAGIEDTLVLKTIYSQYQALFGAEKPLGVKEFYTVLKIAFPQPSSVEAKVANGTTPLDELVLHNVRYAPVKRPQGLDCQWKECMLGFDTEPILQQHILEAHVQPEVRECQWMSCERKFSSRLAVLQHLRTHFAGKIKQLPKKREWMDTPMPIDDSEVSGVPLTAALLLRNLVNYKQHHEYYIAYESELTLLAVQRPRLAEYILAVLGALEMN
ncbi:hypothetical protein BDF14DRAFT_1838773 [Spinellus fusiger]|nr:hypothetical protein BDF14DRAFT_1838773 [Spinellus fusiger]